MLLVVCFSSNFSVFDGCASAALKLHAIVTDTEPKMNRFLQTIIIFMLLKNIYPQGCKIKLSQLLCENITLKAENSLGVMKDDRNDVQSIKFHDCNLKVIPSGAFTDFKNVITIYLNNSKVHNIETEAFKEMTNLQELYLYTNNIEEIKPGTLDSLTNLKFLTLEYNKVVVMQPGALDSLVNLEELNLHQNKISEIKPGTFNGLIRLEFLNLQNNQLEKIDRKCFEKMTNLKTLYLGNNKLKFIPEDAFQDLSNLENLFIGDNFINHLELNCFKNLPKLKKLHLDHNLLTQLDCAMFTNLHNLSYFHLEYNKLTVIPENCFQASSNLNGLFIENNRLTQFDAEKFLGYHSKLYFISLNNNGWKCESLKVIIEVFLNRHVLITDGDVKNGKNVQGIACDKNMQNTEEEQHSKINVNITQTGQENEDIGDCIRIFEKCLLELDLAAYAIPKKELEERRAYCTYYRTMLIIIPTLLAIGYTIILMFLISRYLRQKKSVDIKTKNIVI